MRGANPAIRYNLFFLNLFFQELSGASCGRSARSGKNRFIQKRISTPIRAKSVKEKFNFIIYNSLNFFTQL
jgi:hypothetical protein